MHRRSEARAERVPHHAVFASVTRIEHGEAAVFQTQQRVRPQIGHVMMQLASTAAPALRASSISPLNTPEASGSSGPYGSSSSSKRGARAKASTSASF